MLRFHILYLSCDYDIKMERSLEYSQHNVLVDTNPGFFVNGGGGGGGGGSGPDFQRTALTRSF